MQSLSQFIDEALIKKDTKLTNYKDMDFINYIIDHIAANWPDFRYEKKYKSELVDLVNKWLTNKNINNKSEFNDYILYQPYSGKHNSRDYIEKNLKKIDYETKKLSHSLPMTDVYFFSGEYIIGMFSWASPHEEKRGWTFFLQEDQSFYS